MDYVVVKDGGKQEDKRQEEEKEDKKQKKANTEVKPGKDKEGQWRRLGGTKKR